MATKFSEFLTGVALKATDIIVGLSGGQNTKWTAQQIADFAGAGKVAEAPDDGKTYARENEAWAALGTAAKKNAQTTTLDETADRLMLTGAFGVGQKAGNANTLTDANAVIPNGIYRTAATATGHMLGAYPGQLIHMEQAGGYAVQLAFSSMLPYQAKYRIKDNGVWKAPVMLVTGDDAKAFPFMNLMPDSGRYAGITVNPLATQITQTFNQGSFSNGWNGATIADGGKFIFDNSTSGGSAGPINQRIQDLMVAMGRSIPTFSRYGVEFFAALLTAGSGTTTGVQGLDNVMRYLCFTNGSNAVFNMNTWGTCVVWVRCESGSVHVGNKNMVDKFFWINGEPVPAGTVLPTGQWVHLRVSGTAYSGYDNAFPYFYAVPGATLAMACPAWFGGLVDPGKHQAPILTINQASA